MENKNKDSKKPQRYPSPIILLAAAIYLAYMAYSLWQTTTDGSATGNGLILSWVGCVVFAVLTVVLFYFAFKFNKLNKQALDEEIAQEQEALDNIVFEDADANEENSDD